MSLKMKIDNKIYRYCEDLSLILIFYYFKEEFEKYYTNFKIHYDYFERDFIIDNKIVSSFKRLEHVSKIFNLNLKGLIDNDLLKESYDNKSSLTFFDEEVIIEILYRFLKQNHNIEKFKNNIKNLNNNYQLFLLESFKRLLMNDTKFI